MQLSLCRSERERNKFKTAVSLDQRVTVKSVELACIGETKDKRLLVTLVLLSAVVLFRSGVKGCEENWFGSHCQHQCHCRDNPSLCSVAVCDECEPFYFGDRCEFMAIKLEPLPSSHSPLWLVDGDPETCGHEDEIRFSSFKLSHSAGVKLIHYVFKQGSSLGMPEIYLMDASSFNIVPCHLLADEIHSFGNSAIFQCPSIHVAFTLSIAGKSLQDLCEIYVSPGTNIALQGQSTISDLTEEGNEEEAPLFVDGDRRTCMEVPDGGHYEWKRSFQDLVDVNLILVYGSGRGTWPANFQIVLGRSQSAINSAFHLNDHKKSLQIAFNARNIDRVQIQVVGGWPSICSVEIYGASSLCQQRDCQLDELAPCSAQCDGGLPQCDRKTGVCQRGCKRGTREPFCRTTCEGGKYGEICEDACPSNCGGSLPACHPIHGGCFICPPLRYGPTCEMTCSSNCMNDTCSIVTGLCLSGCRGNFMPPECEVCKPGFYGSNCEMACNENCVDRVCNNVTGLCLSGCNGNRNPPQCEDCLSGFYGSSCELACNSNCLDGVCTRDTGLCMSGCDGNAFPPECIDCLPGFYGSNCEMKCNSNCLAGVCDWETGLCLYGCEGNYYPPQCEVCQPEFYGFTCKLTCNTNCLADACNDDTGLCLSGCEGNFESPECIGCKEGWYGEYCSKLCSPYCQDGTCHIETGECSNCSKGWTGEKCSINETEKHEDCAENGQCAIISGLSKEEAESYRRKKQRSILIAKTLLVFISLLMILALAKICADEREKMKKWLVPARLDLHRGEVSSPASKSSSESVHSSSSSEDEKEAISV